MIRAWAKCRNQTFNCRTTMAVKLALINLTNLPTGRANGGRDQRSRFAACLAFQIPTTRLASRAALAVTASRAPLFEHVQAAFVRTHARIMRACGYRPSCHYPCSTSPTFAR